MLPGAPRAPRNAIMPVRVHRGNLFFELPQQTATVVMTTNMLVALSLCLLAFVSQVAGGITCYRGINIKMPGAHFNQTMNSLGCNNANYCLRGFGTFNGEEGWYSSCVDWQKEDVTCKNYPACQQVVKGNSSYTTCCCKETLCNHLDFTGTAPAPAATTPKGSGLMNAFSNATIVLFGLATLFTS